MIDYEAELNPEQLAVVTAAGGPMLVIAGAGSGKTRTLTFRVARLIEMGASPQGILIATFTNKAAREMLSRVQALVGMDMRGLWGGTFHHLANRILRSNCYLLGYDCNFTILDRSDSIHLLNACIGELGFDKTGKSFPKGNIIVDILSLAINTTSSLTTVMAAKYPHLSRYQDDILKIAAFYRQRKKELNMMDFDDLLLYWRELLMTYPDIRAEYAEAFSHILVDEYQDTNSIQAEILDMLAQHHRNLMVVGDDSQSIYAFRGADYTNILQFPERYPDARIYKLETNYRSTPEILHLANMSICNNEAQYRKNLKAVRTEGVRPVFVSLRNVLQQAEFVARKISEFLRQGIALGQIAVLYRAHYHAMELQMELTRMGIPFEIRSGIRFFEQAHIKDVTAYLRIVANPFDVSAWKRVLALYPKIGKVTLDKIWTILATSQDPLAMFLMDDFKGHVSKSIWASIEGLRNTLEVAAQGGEILPAEMIKIIIEHGYRSFMQNKFSDFESREEDLNQLIYFASQYTSLEVLLSELALMGSTDYEPEGEQSEQGRVVLSSIHQAKGLEWSAVFMICCSEGMLPLARALAEPGGEEEERRLFYVAVTRAKDRLYFCHPLMNYSRYGGGSILMPSRFIKELTLTYDDPAEFPFEELTGDRKSRPA